MKYSQLIQVFEHLVPSQFHSLVRFMRCGLAVGHSSVGTSFETM